ncbi:MAG: ABC transporter ATP-binding protein [Verrucomicrobia bacterium]|nr:ABC transporter ATP-binding protein [Verrucomicrobiota bacterium]
MTGTPSILQMSGVRKGFDTPHGPVHILHDVNAEIAPGDFVILTGPSGSGKTTFLNLAALLSLPTAGTVLFDGMKTSDLSETDLSGIRKRAVGIVFQNFHMLPHRTAEQNVFFRFRYVDVPVAEAREASREALRTVGLDYAATRKARLLSGGEMQRVGIARAIALRPRLLLADEPTGNLDFESAQSIMQCFRRLNHSGITILLATHNESLVQHGTRHLICRKGSIEEGAIHASRSRE